MPGGRLGYQGDSTPVPGKKVPTNPHAGTGVERASISETHSVDPMALTHSVAFLSLALSATLQGADPPDLVLQDANVVDPASRTVRFGSLVIDEGRIVRFTESAIPDARRVIDVDGGWIIPGLVDAHVHSGANIAPGPSPSDPPIVDYFGTPGGARRMLYAGVTVFLDLFGVEEQILGLRDRQTTGGWLGAELLAAGPCLTAPGGHCTEYGIETRTLATPDEARRQVAELARKAPDVVKLVYDHSGYRPTLDRSTFEAAVEASRAAGIPTVVHVSTVTDVEDAVAAGVSAITHLPRSAPIFPELAAEISRKGIFYIPTVVTPLDAVALARDPGLRADPLLTRVASPAIVGAYADTNGFPPYLARWLENGDSIRDVYRESLANLERAGVPLVVGSDAGNFGSVLGWSTHRELELWVELGLPPWTALAGASVQAGHLLGRSWGASVGDEANLLILDASPLDDIANTRRIRAIVQKGRVVERGDLP